MRNPYSHKWEKEKVLKISGYICNRMIPNFKKMVKSYGGKNFKVKHFVTHNLRFVSYDVPSEGRL